METEIYHTLPAEAVKIRETVFVKEQGFRNEFGEIDRYAQHMIVFDQENAIAVCRFFAKTGSRKKIISSAGLLFSKNTVGKISVRFC